MILPALLLAVTPVVATQEPFAAKVVGVTDGDSITVLSGDRQVRVRLFGVDCPEEGQDFSQRAKQFASSLLFGRSVDVIARDTDRYGRTVAVVMVEGRDASLELLRAGLAWHYTQYSSDRTYATAEAEARAARRGLWQQPAPVPPWAWRRPAVRPLAAVPSGPFHGNVKSRVFHAPGCRYYTCKNCVIQLASREDALRSGYRPHVQCVR